MSIADVRERLLVVDDAADTRDLLQRNLTAQGYQVFTAAGVAEAVRILESTAMDLVITDLKMPGTSGLDLIRHVRENFKSVEVMVITGYPSIEGAVTAVKIGAEDYLSKPFTQEELISAVRRTLEKLRVRRLSRGEGAKSAVPPIGLIGNSAPMRKVYDEIARAAGTMATILITGESGTGKELVARAIHYRSARAASPFIPVNCGGIPQELLESELFGHIKGAFTGAFETRAGFFQTAEGGTVFLDEISEMPLSMQVKLLRVLQDREVRMVGSDRPKTMDVRILAATNKDLASLVEKGAFRADLFYRINVITITVPPLRVRGDDIILLAHHFARKFAGELGRTVPKIADRVLQILKDYPWQGNVRELENIMQRMVVMTDGDIVEVPDLPTLMRFSAAREVGLDRPLEEIEAEYIQNVLAGVGGNKTRAAEILGIDRKTLRERLRKMKHKDSQ
jgi:two-component system response regulator HydG